MDYIESLKSFIESTYGLSIINFTPAKRGFFGETWKVVSETITCFIKIDYWGFHKNQYKRSLPVVEFLTSAGIGFVPSVIKTKNGETHCEFNGGIMASFNYAEGIHTHNYPIGRLFDHLSQVYILDASMLDIDEENFRDDIVGNFIQLQSRLPKEDEIADKVRKVFQLDAELIMHCSKRLDIFRSRCLADHADLFLTHGDAGGNCIINNGSFAIIDWDQPKLAPIERDAWFFMHDRQQMEDISKSLSDAGISYRLSFDRFCYYCYYSFFFI